MRPIKLALVLALLAGAAFAADDRYESVVDRTVAYSGGRVSIEQRFGNVDIHTSRGNDVVVKGTIRSSSAEVGRRIRVDVTSGPSGVLVRTVIPQISHRGELSFSVDLDVSVPDEAPLTVSNHFGSINAIGLRAASELVNRQGSIFLRDSSGKQRLENTFGSITIEGANGSIDATNANGAIKAIRVGGNLAAANRFGSVTILGAKGSVSVRNTNGEVELEDVGGNASVINDFGAIRFRNIGRDLVLASKNGRIEGKGVRGGARIDGNFATINVKDIGGSLDVTAANGSVAASDVTGNARVRTSFGPVFLTGVTGGVDVQNQNGAIAVAGLRGTCNPVTIHTSFSSIKVMVPRGVGFNIDARTNFGSINTDVPIVIVRQSAVAQSGPINGGGCRMELVNSNGSITIGKD
jgi:DUF4097 and DUF4098 domain-containing protein YvlB